MSPDAGTEDNGISTEPISLLLFPGLLPLTVSMMNWRNPSSREKMLIIYLYNIEYESYPNLISHSKCGTVHSWFMPCPSLGPKRFWTGPNCFGLCQIVFDGSKSGPNQFGVHQRWLISTEYWFLTHVQNNLDQLENFWTWPKQWGPVQNSFNVSKIAVNP